MLVMSLLLGKQFEDKQSELLGRPNLGILTGTPQSALCWQPVLITATVNNY